MRLSATDRIIREAHQQESAAVEAEGEHPDTEKVTAAPLLRFGLPGPRMPPPIGEGVDVSFDDDADDDRGEDEEGETQVDAKRSAAALDKMRALQEGSLTPPPDLARPSSRHRGLPSGRPGGTAPRGLVAVPSPSTPDLFPQPTPMFGDAATRIAPVPATPRPLPSLDQPPRQSTAGSDQRSSPRRPFDAVPIPSPSPEAPASPPRRGAVGRRTGFVIAAGTAVAVTVIVGAWSARQTAPVRAVIARPAVVGSPVVTATLTDGSGRSPAAPSAGTAVAVESPPSAAPAAAARMEAPAPTVEVMPSPGPALAAPVAPPADSDVERLASPPPSPPKQARAAAKSARAAKARLAKKKAAATKRTARAARSTRAVIGGGGSPGHPGARPPASRGRADPDDTLPISD